MGSRVFSTSPIVNTYFKFAPNVFLAKCSEPHQKGDIIQVETRHGKENDSVVYNLIFEREGFYYYSIIRADGFNMQERAKAKAQKYEEWAAGAEAQSNDYYQRSNKDREFLGLGEPVKVGHHSEGRHRKIIQQAWDNMGKSVAFADKGQAHESKAAYWESRANDINLSMPESVDFYQHKLEKAQEYHEGLKSGKYERLHSYSLTYAKKDVNEAEKNLQLAKRLWE